MTESKFCLNPLGWSPWTLRFYQAVMTRCIPVLIADDIEFPFESEARPRPQLHFFPFLPPANEAALRQLVVRRCTIMRRPYPLLAHPVARKIFGRVR
jgi:hypothetical protein